MKKDYTGKRTTVALDPKLAKRIKKMLKGKKTILADYTRDALDEKLHVDESKIILVNLAKITSTAQYHKLKQLEHDIEELKKDHVTAKELNSLELESMRIERHVDMIHKKLLGAVNTKIKTYREAIALLKTAQNNPIIKKELEKL